jgi:hypothetical protein
MAVLKQVNTNNDVGLRMFTAPVKNKKLGEKKTLQATPTNMRTNSLDKIKILD